MTMKSAVLLEEAAAYMECQYLSDLRFLSPYQRCVLAAHLERHDAQRYTLFEWNDALEYLSGYAAESTAEEARSKLLYSLRQLGR